MDDYRRNVYNKRNSIVRSFGNGKDVKMKIISPIYDMCMKELFRNNVVLKYFISDILGIPIKQIRSVRLLNTFLARKYRNRKQGILDFNFTDREEYHSIYCLRDEKGNIFSDILEIHTLELRKKLTGKEPVDDWIRLFNAESEEDLDMIRTKNIGIREAIEEVRHMSLRGILRARYEAHQKAVRDQKAQDAYVREVAMKEGREKGREIGREEGLQGLVELCRSFGLNYEDTCKKIHSIKEYEMTSDESIRKCFYKEKSGS